MFLRNISAESERFAAIIPDCFRGIFDWIVRQSAYNYARSFFANLYAMASPMLVPAPVTIATFPCSRRFCFSDPLPLKIRIAI
jgi:hypothetical protein